MAIGERFNSFTIELKRDKFGAGVKHIIRNHWSASKKKYEFQSFQANSANLDTFAIDSQKIYQMDNSENY